MDLHTHTHTPRIKWTHYLYEFFMLFLAVTAGYLVENRREHYVERERGLQYIRSFTDDLRKDIFQLDSLIKKRQNRESQIDSIHFILTSPDPDKYGSQVYYFVRYLPRPYQFIDNDGTMQQLKNAGNLRLIDDQATADTIMAYERQHRFIETITNREDQLIQRLFNSINKLFDPEVFNQMNTYDIEFTRPPGNPKLMSHDKEIIRNFLSDLHYIKTVNVGAIGWFKKQKQRAENTLAYLKKEYDLK